MRVKIMKNSLREELVKHKIINIGKIERLIENTKKKMLDNSFTF
jgi:hypothetical protein